MHETRLEKLMNAFARALPRWRGVVLSRLETQDWQAVATVAHQLCETALTYGLLELSDVAGLCADEVETNGDALAREGLVSRMLAEMDLVTAGSRL